MTAAFDPRHSSDEDLPPLKDWPPPEIVARWEARKQAARRRQVFRRKVLALALAAMVVVAGAVFLLTRRSGLGPAARPASPPPPPTMVVWVANLATGSFITVVTNPGELGAVAVVIPDQTLVDIPGGPSTVGAATGEPGLLLAAVQATLNRRVDHYLVMNDFDLRHLLDQMGPIEVQLDEPFESDGRIFGPGRELLAGGPAVAYLEAGTELDRTSRWEEILTAVFSGDQNPRQWDGPLGTTDSVEAVRSVLRGADQAAVLEIPTAPSEGGGLVADPEDVADFLQGHLGPAATPLVRVIVLNANGRRGEVIVIATRLAPLGYRVVAAQQARSPLALTQIVASDESYLSKAAEVQAILGVGSVYVGPESSGAADITIVVGKDFKAG